MQVFHTVAEWRAYRQTLGTVAFVPTMGNLHDGHLSLVREARQHAEHVVVSIFVNRLQFGPNEDFDCYPRTFAADCEKLAAAGVAAVFAPDERELYPQPQQVFVEPSALADGWCGASRPGHFRGVCTVVAKLFHLVAPNVAVFGKKDYQQFAILCEMVEQLAFPIRMIGVETGRDADGLARSSRNGYLSAALRAEAPRLYATLQQLAAALRAGRQDYRALENAAVADLQQAGWAVDYLAICERNRLQPLPDGQPLLPAVILAAARLGKTRLIDNIEV